MTEPAPEARYGNLLDVVDISEIGARTSRTPDAVSNWAKRTELRFPAHLKMLNGRRVWFWPDVEEWFVARMAPRERCTLREGCSRLKDHPGQHRPRATPPQGG